MADNPLLTFWRLLEFREQDAVIPVLPKTRVTAYFHETAEVSGSGGCNTYGARFRIEPPDSIAIGELVHTEIFCGEPAGVMEQESRFFDGLLATTTFQANGQELLLSWQNGEQAMRFEAIKSTQR